jgi:hypothetical protein
MNIYKLSSTQTTNETYIISYLKIRLIIGFIGVLLPILLPVGILIFKDNYSPAFQSSISHYYYTKMHILFTGLLCVLGTFLISYRGKYVGENILSTIAGVCAISVSVFPTPITDYIHTLGNTGSFFSIPTLHKNIGIIHFASATFMFICFVFLGYVYFTKEDSGTTTHFKKRRNYIYILCSVGITISLLLAALFIKFPATIPSNTWLLHHYIYFFESTSLFFFGFAWLVKGTFMWPQKGLLYKVLIQHLR